MNCVCDILLTNSSLAQLKACNLYIFSSNSRRFLPTVTGPSDLAPGSYQTPMNWGTPSGKVESC